MVDHTVRKEKIVWYKQFLLLPQCFQKTCSAETKKPGLVWERVNDFENKPFENIVGKGDNAGNQHCLLFPQRFLPFPKQISI